VDVPRNTEFENLMIALCDEIYRLEPDPRFPETVRPSEARLRAAANLLVGNLLPRTGGIAAFVAREIITATQEGLEILKNPIVQHLAGAQSVWSAVQEIARRYLHETQAVTAHVTRARNGQLVLAWLAEIVPELEGRGRLIQEGEPVIDAARAWMEASLSLAQK